MRSSLFTGLLATAASQVSAQNPYNITSDPFSLVLLSANETINGTSLYSCHQGAAINGLCVGSKYDPTTSDTFNFNTSYYDGGDQSGKSGNLVSIIIAGTFDVPQTMSLVPSFTSNVAVPIFFPGSDGGQLVKFDGTNKLSVSGFVDDTVDPINTYAPNDYYRWVACNTYYGYRYFTLAWVMGTNPPQNPSCQKVEVVRVFG